MANPPSLDTNRIITNQNLLKVNNITDGVLILVDKPLGWTSFDVVNKIRSSIKYGIGIKKIKVGHAGTLDPMATGLLLVTVGKYTKLIESLTAYNKAYKGIVKLGATTPSYDSEADEENICSTDHINKQDIDQIIPLFRGEQLQMPPIFSAIKINGQTAHKLARKGKDVKLKAREINITHLDLLKFDNPLIELEVTCSKGTYIRSLAHDIGQKLGTGAYLYGLVRTKVEDYDLNDSLSIDGVIDWIDTLPEQDITSHG